MAMATVSSAALIQCTPTSQNTVTDGVNLGPQVYNCGQLGSADGLNVTDILVFQSASASVTGQHGGTTYGLTFSMVNSAALTNDPTFTRSCVASLTTGSCVAGGDSSGLSNLISGGGLAHFATDPSALATPAAIEQGKSLLSQMFGSQDLSGVISTVAEKAGVDGSIITKLMPVAAALLGGILSKNSAEGGNITELVDQIHSAGHSGILGAVKGMAAKLFG